MKSFALVAGLCACGSSAPVANHVTVPADPPPAPVGVALAGPFATPDVLARKCWDGDGTPATITSLGETRTMHATIALREYRHHWTAASCAVTVQTANGVYTSPGFLCSADRSDEQFTTENVSVSVTGWEATIRFSADQATGDRIHSRPPPRHVTTHHVIRCSLGPAAPSCTQPPAIGGYDIDVCAS